MKRSTHLIVTLAISMVAADYASAATWSGTAGDGLWETAGNWNATPTSTVPGTSGNTDTSATISGSYSASLSSDITAGALITPIDLHNGATLTVSNGSKLSGAASVDGVSSGTANSSLIMNGGNWSSTSTIFIARILSSTNAGKTSLLQFNGGTYTNTNAASSGRMEIGHGDNQDTATFQMTGGTWSMASFINWQGRATNQVAGDIAGKAKLVVSGGSFSAGLANVGNSDTASDGLYCELGVVGSNATLARFSGINLYRNNGTTPNLTGQSIAKFTLDSNGVTQITSTGALNLGPTGYKGDLWVDVGADPSAGVGGVTLFHYGSLTNGSFGNITIVDSVHNLTLTPGADKSSLTNGQYFLDYGTGTNSDIALYYSVPEPASMGLMGVAGFMLLWRKRAV